MIARNRAHRFLPSAAFLISLSFSSVPDIYAEDEYTGPDWYDDVVALPVFKVTPDDFPKIIFPDLPDLPEPVVIDLMSAGGGGSGSGGGGSSNNDCGGWAVTHYDKLPDDTGGAVEADGKGGYKLDVDVQKLRNFGINGLGIKGWNDRVEQVVVKSVVLHELIHAAIATEVNPNVFKNVGAGWYLGASHNQEAAHERDAYQAQVISLQTFIDSGKYLDNSTGKEINLTASDLSSIQTFQADVQVKADSWATKATTLPPAPQPPPGGC